MKTLIAFTLLALIVSSCDSTPDVQSANQGKKEVEFRVFGHPNWDSLKNNEKEEVKKILGRCYSILKPKFDKAESVSVYSLIPKRINSQDGFNGYKVIGEYQLSDRNEILDFEKALLTGVIPKPNFLCEFQPRHGIRVSSGTVTFDLLLCYKCADMAAVGFDESEDLSDVFFDSDFREFVDGQFDLRGIAIAP